MTQQILFLQSLWAMERRHTDGQEHTLERNIELIAGAGFDGVSTQYVDPAYVARLTDLLAERRLVAEGQCFPQTVDDLKPVLETATKHGCLHLDIQPDIRPRRIDDCIPLLEGWTRLAEQVPFPVYIETHRDRMTTDLYFCLDLLDRLPNLRLLADLSHFLVGREFADPVPDEAHAQIHRILDNTWAMHGRVASREQVQVEISFPHHAKWLNLFLDWWRYGFSSFRARAGADAVLPFTCELGPKPYAITGADGNDLSDRWQDSLLLRDKVREQWEALASAPQPPTLAK